MGLGKVAHVQFYELWGMVPVPVHGLVLLLVLVEAEDLLLEVSQLGVPQVQLLLELLHPPPGLLPLLLNK